MGILDKWLSRTIDKWSNQIGHRGIHTLHGNPTSQIDSRHQVKNFSLSELRPVYLSLSLGLLVATANLIFEIVTSKLFSKLCVKTQYFC